MGDPFDSSLSVGGWRLSLFPEIRQGDGRPDHDGEHDRPGDRDLGPSGDA